MKRSLLNFAVFFVGVCILMGGVVFWIGVTDYDQHYYYETTHDEFPSNKGELGYYDQLTAEQQRIVDGALNGETYTFSEENQTPPPLVRKGDSYHEFASFRTFDWTDPLMVAATLTIAAGFLVTLEGIRREQFPNMTLADVKYHMPIIGGK